MDGASNGNAEPSGMVIRTLYSQNCRGIKTDARLAETLDCLARVQAFVAFLQETWRTGQEQFVQNGWTFLGSAPDAQQGRGSAGVAIVLSPHATAAWKAANCEWHASWWRVVAARLLALDPRSGRSVGIFLISGYAPTSAASAAEWQTYYVTLKHTFEHRLSTQELGTRLNLSAMDTYVNRRLLRWLGHVARMDFNERLPRKMLSAWVAAPRPNGAPELTYGRAIGKALDRFNIGREWWPQLAADRAAWRETLRELRPPPNFIPTPPTPPPEPLARMRPRRAAAAATLRAIDATLANERVPLRQTIYRPPPAAPSP